MVNNAASMLVIPRFVMNLDHVRRGKETDRQAEREREKERKKERER